MQQNKPEVIQAEILSPVAIGDGGKLSPLADYFYQGGKLHRIDHDKLTAWLEAHSKIDQYIEAVRESSRYAKDSFWTRNMGISNMQALSNGKSYHIVGSDNPVEVRTIVKNGNQPYLPGSSLKGAFKTALLYNWLTKEKKEALQSIIQALLFETIKDSKGGDILDNLIKGFLTPNFGENLPKDFHHLMVSDSNPIDAAQIQIAVTKRLHLSKGTFDIPVVSETIAPSAQNLHFFLNIFPNFLHPELKPLNAEGSKYLFQVVNAFSKAHVAWLLDTLTKQEDNIVRGGNSRIYDDAVEWLQNLQEDIRKAHTETAYMQIGFGKSWFANSCGLAIFQKNPAAFNALRRFYKVSKSRSPLFPSTIALGTHNSLPQGWVKLTLKK